MMGNLHESKYITDIVYKVNFQGFISPYICCEKVQANVLVISAVLVLVLVPFLPEETFSF